ncbi:MAG: cation transporter [Bacillota bacterium]|nr:cation transporter [Bacillota bacterium]
MQIELKVSGMSCGHCKKRVENALQELGLSTFTVDLEQAKVTATLKEPVTKAQVVEAIEEAGYDVEHNE